MTQWKAAQRVTDSKDIYARVTEKIIADLEKGNLTWLQPWKNSPAGLPQRFNGLSYSGINVLVLWAEAVEKGYQSPMWMTFQQAKELGGHVRKGEHGVTVVKSGTYIKTETDDKGDEIEKASRFLKTYTVFNIDQIDDLPAHYYVQPQQPDTKTRIEHAEEWVKSTGATIQHGGNEAKYMPHLDRVQMPPFEAFRDAESYYNTLAHELVHWTKHPTRLDRDFGAKRFGDEGYAIEELVAQLGAAFVSADLGITPQPREDDAAYIASWLRVLKQDKHAIFTAASHAQKAVDHLHGKAHQIDETISQVYGKSREREDETRGI